MGKARISPSVRGAPFLPLTQPLPCASPSPPLLFLLRPHFSLSLPVLSLYPSKGMSTLSRLTSFSLPSWTDRRTDRQESLTWLNYDGRPPLNVLILAQSLWWGSDRKRSSLPVRLALSFMHSFLPSFSESIYQPYFPVW